MSVVKKSKLVWAPRNIDGSIHVPSAPNLEPTPEPLFNSTLAMTVKSMTLTIIAGSTESGKTNLLRNIIFLQAQKQLFNRCIVFCPTALNQPGRPYSFTKSENVVIAPSIEILEGIISQQDANPKLVTALVLDDCLGAISLKDDIFTRLACGSRHKRLNIFILVQDLGKVPSVMKDNATTLFVSKIKRHTLKHAFDMQQGFRKLKDFEAYVDENVGKDYQMLRLNLLGSSPKTHCLFKPPICPKFVLG